MYTEIIWDFDGTLFDSYPGMSKAFQSALNELGVEESREEIFKKMKVSLGSAIDYYVKNFKIDGKELKDGYDLNESKLDISNTYPFPYAKEICEHVKLKGRNFIYTHRDSITIKLLEYHNMTKYFTEIVTREHGLRRKPDPEGFLYIINKYNISKSKALAIGDRELDLLAAENSGVKSCLFDGNCIDNSCRADYEIKSLQELYDILKF
jgi:phosphoglycolate phosphatase-like HAD superfamily hydrolase